MPFRISSRIVARDTCTVICRFFVSRKHSGNFSGRRAPFHRNSHPSAASPSSFFLFFLFFFFQPRKPEICSFEGKKREERDDRSILILAKSIYYSFSSTKIHETFYLPATVRDGTNRFTRLSLVESSQLVERVVTN